MSTESELFKFFENIAPVELAKLRGTRQDTSTRDKQRFLIKVIEIQDILQKLKVEFSLKKEDKYFDV